MGELSDDLGRNSEGRQAIMVNLQLCGGNQRTVLVGFTCPNVIHAHATCLPVMAHLRSLLKVSLWMTCAHSVELFGGNLAKVVRHGASFFELSGFENAKKRGNPRSYVRKYKQIIA